MKVWLLPPVIIIIILHYYTVFKICISNLQVVFNAPAIYATSRCCIKDKISLYLSVSTNMQIVANCPPSFMVMNLHWERVKLYHHNYRKKKRAVRKSGEDTEVLKNSFNVDSIMMHTHFTAGAH